MIRIYCSKADATLLETETLTAGMVNTPNVLFTFSSDWEGLGKTAIVRAGTVIREVVLQDNQITIPAECLAKAGVNLIVGVWGGNFVTELPTVWCACGEIQDSTNPAAAQNHEEGTTSNVAQMLAIAERAESSLDAIQRIIDTAESVGDRIEAILDIVPEHIDDNSEAWAVGTRFGEPVSDDDVTYHNNSKYYSQQSEIYAGQSEDFADQVSDDKDSTLLARDEALTAKTAAETAMTAAQAAQAAAEAAVDEIVSDAVSAAVDDWLEENISQETGYALDRSLSGTSSAAPADQVGSAFDTIGAFSNNVSADLKAMLSVGGNINYDTGNPRTSSAASSYYYSPHIFVKKGTVVISRNVNAASNAAQIAVYDISKTYSKSDSVAGVGSIKNVTLTMPYDGFVRVCCSGGSYANATIKTLSGAKTLNILVLGNSFSQDAFAYVPPILNEILPEYEINYVVAYKSSFDIQDHIDLYNAAVDAAETPDTADDKAAKYTWTNIWDHGLGAWSRRTSTGVADNSKNLIQLMQLHDWDIVYVQPACSVTSDESIINNIINPGRVLLRILQSLATKPFSYVMGQWLSVKSNGDNGEEVFPLMVHALQLTKERLGLNCYIPIGTAIQNARTNAVLQALGKAENMLYDQTHQQAGIPALLSAYVIVLKILELVGESRRGIYASTFVPTNENCIAINASKTVESEEDYDSAPMPMTHGASVGVTTQNVRAAQEIATLAFSNPTVITDCSGIIL